MRLLITMLLAALIGAVALAACGDEEEPAPSPAPASLAEATPAPLWPRTDCPEGWLPYLDPDGYFSFCYPAGLKLVTDSVGDPRGFGTIVGVYPVKTSPESSYGVSFIWRSHGNGTYACPNGGGGGANFIAYFQQDRAIAGRTLRLCITDSFKDAAHSQLGYRRTSFEYPVEGGGVISAKADVSGMDRASAEDISLRILDSLRVR